jgi:hypothetical protein
MRLGAWYALLVRVPSSALVFASQPPIGRLLRVESDRDLRLSPRKVREASPYGLHHVETIGPRRTPPRNRDVFLRPRTDTPRAGRGEQNGSYVLVDGRGIMDL